MAIMNPNQLVYNNGSQAEESFFNQIKNASGTNEWHVYHSLNIKNSDCNVFTEGDFVILIPNKGIIVLEVKGGAIRYNAETNKWYSSSRKGVENTLRKSPFLQAENASESLRDYLIKINPKYKQILFSYGVVFPECNFDTTYSSIEFDANLVYKNNELISDFISRLCSITKKHFNIKNEIFPIEWISEIESLFRKSIYIPPSKLVLNKEQTQIFHEINRYKCALIGGGARTGKTILAIKTAIEKNNEDYKVGFFTHNLSFASYLNNALPKSRYPNITVSSFYEYLICLCENAKLMNKNDPILKEKLKNKVLRSRFYAHDLIELSFKALKKNNFKKFDVLMIDECQDFIQPNNLILLSLLLKGNFSEGSWYIFGDYDNQLIYSDSVSGLSIPYFLEAFGVRNYIKKQLKTNISSPKKIVEELERISKQEIEFENHEEGLVKYIEYTTQTDELDKLKFLLNDLIHNKKINLNKITILSNSSKDNNNIENGISFLFEDDELLKRIVSDKEKGKIYYDRLRRYKGLSNDVIIIIDLNSYKTTESEEPNLNLLYSGLTRANQECYIFETSKEKTIRENLIN